LPDANSCIPEGISIPVGFCDSRSPAISGMLKQEINSSTTDSKGLVRVGIAGSHRDPAKRLLSARSVTSNFGAGLWRARVSQISPVAPLRAAMASPGVVTVALCKIE
jgi:hypothetical protein